MLTPLFRLEDALVPFPVRDFRGRPEQVRAVPARRGGVSFQLAFDAMNRKASRMLTPLFSLEDALDGWTGTAVMVALIRLALRHEERDLALWIWRKVLDELGVSWFP